MTTPPPRVALPDGLLRRNFELLSRLIDKRSFAAQRRLTDVGTRGIPLPPGTRSEPATVGGVPGRRVRLNGGARAGALLYLHGGGYVLGSSRSELSCTAYLAAGLGVDALRLETNGALAEAIALYRSCGYHEIERFTDDPYAQHWFEKGLG